MVAIARLRVELAERGNFVRGHCQNSKALPCALWSAIGPGSRLPVGFHCLGRRFSLFVRVFLPAFNREGANRCNNWVRLCLSRRLSLFASVFQA
jgi:hypothetical protein